MSKNLDKQKKNFIQIIFSLIETILTLSVVIICVIIIAQRITNNEYGLLGYRLFKIESGSMIPRYQINDVILVKEVDTNTIEIGDDVTYMGNAGDLRGKVVTHELVEKEEYEGETIFYTKGIANDTIDPKVSASQILGIVQGKMQILTFITNLLLNAYTLYFVIILPVTIYIVFSLIHTSERKERKIQKKIQQRQKEIETELEAKKRNTARMTEMKKRKTTSNTKNKKDSEK